MLSCIFNGYTKNIVRNASWVDFLGVTEEDTHSDAILDEYNS